MSDPFHSGIPIEDLALVWAMMAADPATVYQVLTKRPGVMRSRLGRPDFRDLMRDGFGRLASLAGNGRRLTPARARILADIEAARHRGAWPLPNVMLGVSAGTRQWAARRVPVLRQVPASARFISAEPLIGPVGDLDLSGISWLIAGGESGPGYRPLDPAWARSLRDQCRSQGVAFWFKQVDGQTPKAGGDLLDGRQHKEHYDMHLQASR
jgi:protein gp37